MTSINIISKNECELNVDVTGDYMLIFTGVTGSYNIKLLKAGEDYIKICSPPKLRLHPKTERIAYREALIEVIQSDLSNLRSQLESNPGDTELQSQIEQYNAQIATLQAEIVALRTNEEEDEEDYQEPTADGYVGEVITNEYVDYDYLEYQTYWHQTVANDVISYVDYDTITSLLNTLFSAFVTKYGHILEYNSNYSKFQFNVTIIGCSDNFKYLLGITNLPKTYGSYSDVVPVFNGPQYIFIDCDKLYSPIRYCWQTKPSNPTTYASVQKYVSISYNSYGVLQPFSLAGNQFKVNGNDLKDVKFSIKGMYGEPIEFTSDLLWTFELQPLPEEDFLPGLIPQEEEEAEEKKK